MSFGRYFLKKKRIFGFSKPSEFIQEIISFVTDKNSLIMDFICREWNYRSCSTAIEQTGCW